MKNILLILFSSISILVLGQEFEFTPVPLSPGGLTQITDISGSGDGSGRLFVTQRDGVVRIVQNQGVLAQQFLSIGSLVHNDNNERGLLGLAFHPSYPDSNYIYVNYVRSDAEFTTRIARFTVPAGTPNNADESSIRVIIDVPGYGTQQNHKAGDLAFGPDGYLYIATGDGGGSNDPGNNGQDSSEYLGKILRLNVNATNGNINYTIPAGNPFVGSPGLDEIFMLGLRNPWRISFDRETGDLWIADVGQGLWEEVNHIPAGTGAGRNLGWDCYEGNHTEEPLHCNANDILTFPVLEYRHCPDGSNQCGSCITGGFLYRGNEYPEMYGKYIAVDYNSNDIWQIEPTGETTYNIDSYEANSNVKITTFGEADDGELFAGNLTGTLFYVTLGSPLPLQWEALIATPVANGNKIQWTLHNFAEVEFFEIQRSSTLEFIDYISVTELEADPDKITYAYHDPYYAYDGIYYRIAAHLQDGSVEYSPVARIMPNPLSKPSLAFDFNNNMWRIHLPTHWQNGNLTLFDLQGRLVYQIQLSDRSNIELSRPVIPGVYFITIHSNGGIWSDKVVR